MHASYDPAVVEELSAYRVLRVGVLGSGVDAPREVERRSPPPDVFVVRSPVAGAAGDPALVVTIRVQALRFTSDGEQVAACGQQTDVTVVDDAVNLIEVTLAPGDCP